MALHGGNSAHRVYWHDGTPDRFLVEVDDVLYELRLNAHRGLATEVSAYTGPRQVLWPVMSDLRYLVLSAFYASQVPL